MATVMPLDWNPLSKPRAGHEEEFHRILALDLGALDEETQEAEVQLFQAITVAPFETLEAPRVGIDEAAEAWLLEQAREADAEGRIDELREDMMGYPVLDLLPPCPGLPAYGGDGFAGIDRYTFPGERVEQAVAIIGPALAGQARETMGAETLAAYGQALLDRARAYASQHGFDHLETQREPPSAPADSPEALAHVLLAAAQWCQWWSERGHGLEPHY